MRERSENFIVRSYECQADGTIRAAALLQHLQELAAAHAEERGWGYRELLAIDGFWVLVNLRLEIAYSPRWQEKVALGTWPSGHDGLRAFREFRGRDARGRELFRAGSEWMILDRTGNRPRPLQECGFDLSGTGDRLIPGMERLNPLAAYDPVGRITVPYSAIDLNGHVNNTEYVRWGMDAVRRSTGWGGTVRTLQIAYLSEVFEGEEIDLLVGRSRSGAAGVLGRRDGDERPVFLMEVEAAPA